MAIEQFYMVLDPNDAKKFIWAIIRLEDNLSRQAHSELPRKMAYEYKNELVQAISQQKYVSRWREDKAKRYHPRYQDWKFQSLRGNLGFWLLKGDLLKALEVFPLSSIGKVAPPGMSARRSGAYLGGPKSRPYMVGIKANRTDSGGKSWLGRPWEGKAKGPSKYIAMYAHVLEFGGDYRDRGGGDHPKRPVFGPTLVDYSREKAPITASNVLRQIGRWVWRK